MTEFSFHIFRNTNINNELGKARPFYNVNESDIVLVYRVI